MTTEPAARTIVEQCYRSVLHRAPDAQAVGYVQQLSAGCIDEHAVADELRRSGEYRELVAPVVQRLRQVHELLFGRAPRADELGTLLAAFRHRLAAAPVPAPGPAFDALLDVRPLSVEMDITNQCNIRCVMCYFSDPRIGQRRREDLSPAQYERIAVQLFPWVQRLSLTLGTEPLIHPHVVDFVRIAKGLGVPKVYVNTNGVRLTPELGERLIAAGLDAVNVSLDAGTAATFERVRKGARWQTVLDHVAALQQTKARLGVDHPRLSMSFVMMRSTVHELTAFVRTAAALGVKAVHLMHMISYASLDNEQESLAGDAARANALIDAARAVGRELAVQVLAPAPLPVAGASAPSHDDNHLDLARARNWFDLNLASDDDERGCCPFPWHFLGINYDGSVAPCGWWFDGAPLGNLLRDDFAAIWQGEPLRRLRGQLLRNEPGPDCRKCPAAGMGSAAQHASFAVRQPSVLPRHPS